MTREEAKETLLCLYDAVDEEGVIDPHTWYKGIQDNIREALSMAIKALEQEPTDAVSREAVCDYIAEFVNNEFSTQAECEMVDAMIEGVQHLPPVTVRSENLCDHCKHFEKCERDEREFWQTREWIESDSDDPCWYMCSECHRRVDNKENYCPSCGAKMIEPQERSEEQA